MEACSKVLKSLRWAYQYKLGDLPTTFQWRSRPDTDPVYPPPAMEALPGCWRYIGSVPGRHQVSWVIKMAPSGRSHLTTQETCFWARKSAQAGTRLTEIITTRSRCTRVSPNPATVWRVWCVHYTIHDATSVASYVSFRLILCVYLTTTGTSVDATSLLCKLPPLNFHGWSVQKDPFVFVALVASILRVTVVRVCSY